MKKKILFIEDDTLIIKLYTFRLKLENYQIISAEDGETGFKKFQNEQPDLVVLDLMLPKISGLDVLKKIRQQDKKIPIIIYTVLSDAKRIKEAKESGATDYYIKADTNPQNLVKKINDFLN
jgi:DNA-binding response OmpR family regulator